MSSWSVQPRVDHQREGIEVFESLLEKADSGLGERQEMQPEQAARKRLTVRNSAKTMVYMTRPQQEKWIPSAHQYLISPAYACENGIFARGCESDLCSVLPFALLALIDSRHRTESGC
jgi:hypothetical protein